MQEEHWRIQRFATTFFLLWLPSPQSCPRQIKMNKNKTKKSSSRCLAVGTSNQPHATPPSSPSFLFQPSSTILENGDRNIMQTWPVALLIFALQIQAAGNKMKGQRKREGLLHGPDARQVNVHISCSHMPELEKL